MNVIFITIYVSYCMFLLLHKIHQNKGKIIKTIL